MWHFLQANINVSRVIQPLYRVDLIQGKKTPPHLVKKTGAWYTYFLRIITWGPVVPEQVSQCALLLVATQHTLELKHVTSIAKILNLRLLWFQELLRDASALESGSITSLCVKKIKYNALSWGWRDFKVKNGL